MARNHGHDLEAEDSTSDTTPRATTRAATPSVDIPRSPRALIRCTFCHHLSPAPGRVVGRSARLACSACHAALLSLTICWVCGGVVYRGTDCVSLGWCFWHRACYGCIFCGARRIVEGLTVESVFEEDDGSADEEWAVEGKTDGWERIEGRGRARELEQVPICAHCVVELEQEDAERAEGVVKRALRAGDRRDGGLARARWDEGDATSHPHDTESFRERRRRFGGDGANGSPDDDVPEWTPCPVPLESAIYVSSFDPLSQPAFKPSPTKPIPRWMSMLPGQRSERMP